MNSRVIQLIIKQGPWFLLISGVFFISVGLTTVFLKWLTHGDQCEAAAIVQQNAQSEPVNTPPSEEQFDENSRKKSSADDVETSTRIDSIPWPSFLSSGAILIGAGIALLGLYSQRQLSRASATLELLNRNIWDVDCISARQQFNKLSRKDGGLQIWADKSHWDSSQVDSISAMLNDYELMAIGVRTGVLDEDVYKEFCRGIVIDHWEQAKPFIDKIRESKSKESQNSKNIFIQFEALAAQWKKNKNYEGKTAESVLSDE